MAVIFGKVGTDSNDTLDPLGAAGIIDGKAGTDTLIFNDVQSHFSVVSIGGVTRVYGLPTAAPEYADKLFNLNSIEILSFTDNNNVVVPLQPVASINFTKTGTDNDDLMDPLGVAGTIDGKIGTDTLVFFDDSTNFDFVVNSGVLRLTGKAGASAEYAGNEYIIANVEKVQFLDLLYSVPGSDPGVIPPTPEDMVIIGTDASEILAGGIGNDKIDSAGGSDLIDGGAGTDLLIIFDNSSNFSIVSLSGVTHLFGKASAALPYQNTESWIINTESIQFQDKTVALPETPLNVIIGQTATTSDDIIDPVIGSGMIDGLAGTDTILFFDHKENFLISTVGGITRVIGKPNADPKYAGQELVLTNVEQLQFLNAGSAGTIVIGGDGSVQTQNPNFIFDPAPADTSPNPIIMGTPGNDVIDHLGGSDIIDGGVGTDKILFFDSINNFTVRTLAGVTRVLGNDTANPQYSGAELIVYNVESLAFQDANLPLAPVTGNLIFDQAPADSTPNPVIFGTTGDDIIDHMGGADFIDGSDGYDTVLFFDSREHFQITTMGGETRIVGKVSASEAYRGFEVILVNVEKFLFSDVLVSPTTRIITGTLSGGDYLVGTTGDDIFDPVGGGDYIDGGAGTDTVLINDKLNNFTFWTLHGVTLMYAEDTDATNEDYRQSITTLERVEKVQFLDGTKFLETSNVEVIYGSSNDGETISGTAGDDVIVNLGGNDFVDGGAGNDVALFFDTFDHFIVTKLGNRFRVFGKNVDFVDWDAYEGKMSVLDNVETLQFLDRTITLSDDLNQLNPDIFGATSSGSEDIVGTEGNNIIDHLGGSDRVDGGGGTDTLLYWDARANYDVITMYGITHVLGHADAQPTYSNTDVRLVSVENLLFTDYTEAVSTSIPANKNVIFGHASGGGSSETLTATAGDDLIDHSGGSDNINGGSGFDTLLFFDSIEHFTVTKLAGVTHIIGSSEANPYYRGTDTTIQNIERLEFIDGVIDSSISSGSSDNDLLVNSTLSETFDGGGGIDTLAYSGARSSYLVLKTGSSYTVTRGTLESDTLRNVERLDFSDTNVAIDMADGQAASNTVKMLGAAFGSASVGNEYYVGIGLDYFDNGWTMKQVADMIVNFDSFKQLSDREFAATLCHNTGYPSTVPVLDMLEQLLHAGFDRGDMLWAAAELDVNAQSINLLGLQLTGVEFVPQGG